VRIILIGATACKLSSRAEGFPVVVLDKDVLRAAELHAVTTETLA